MDLKEIRSKFPYLETDQKYFNHAAISPLSTIVNDKVRKYLDIRTNKQIEPYFETLPQAIGAKEKLAKMLGVDINLIGWSANVSTSLNILAQGLKWNNGDEIILNNLEFPSNVYPFLNLESQGVKVLFAEAENGAVDLEQIERLVSSKTKLISISMVQFLTGYKADLKLIGEFCKSKGILFCVDGIQGIGTSKIDIPECNIDFFAGGSHKWLMGFQGLGYFYLSNKLLNTLNQKNVGWTSVQNPWNLLDYKLELLDSAERYQLGTLPRIAIIALDASLSFFEMVGLNFIEERIKNNSIYLINELSKNGYKTVLENVSEKNISGIVSFLHDDSVNIVKQLEKRKIICSVREGMVRISPHYYNTIEEFDDLIDAINKITIKR